MEYRPLGATGMNVSLAGLGTGGANVFGQRRGADASESRRLVRVALDAGINYFDTAQGYGMSDVLLAGALDGVPRAEYYLATKYTYRKADGTLLTPEEVDAAIRTSLTRLRIETIDVFQIHSLTTDSYDEVIDRHLPMLIRARDEGLIRAIGVTESFAGDDPSHRTLSRALQDRHFDVVMVGYNVLHQTAERDVLPVARDREVGVVVMAAVRRALASQAALETLVAELKRRGDLASDAVPDLDPLGWLVHDGTPSVPAGCYRYVAEDAAVSTVLTGTFDPDHLLENVAAISLGPLPSQDRDRLRAAFGHLDIGLGR